ncbi:potassium transporter Kup [Acidocella sp.]|uniref:potassium transporter Kup n=1 Tax=Acidocella sp. TaxID=50710 RepID=UPI002605FC82|nr:potassium transporter Kup [Acidocella sp.]
MQPTSTAAKPLRLAAVIGVLGVVYGDIGTSPLYALQTCLGYFPASQLARADVLGLLSQMFWALIITVTLKYVTFVMRADNKGEGGILALTALAQRAAATPRTRLVLGLLGIIGAGLFFGDGMITPAISVLSAISGLQVVWPSLSNTLVEAASILVITVLFMAQKHGTARVGAAFGPVMVVWFLSIALLGTAQILKDPQIFAAINPYFAFSFMARHKLSAFIILGAVVLTVTGAEALYADMSHFGRKPIRLSWSWFVLPALLLNYFGQGALVLANPAAAANPFFIIAPAWAQIPLVVLSTMATIIASQAVISGAYSMARQCVQLGLFPRMEIRHTSATEEGQIYVPQINWLLAAGVILLVLTFQTSNNLAWAYGIAVTGTFICTNILAMFVYRRVFAWSVPLTALVFGAFLVVDLAFFGANLLKFLQGGWVPLGLGLLVAVVMTTWQRGRALIYARWTQDSLPLSSFITRLPNSRVLRCRGTSVFLTGNLDYVPGALLHNLKHNQVLHERVLFVRVNTLDIPAAPPEARALIHEAAEKIYQITLNFGFMESPNVPRALAELPGLTFDPMTTSYFLGRESIVPAGVSKLKFIRRWLFLYLARNAIPATEFFQIPADRVVELGVRIAI